MTATRNESGLTLIEMIVVVAILAILAGIVMGSLDRTRDDAARTAVETSLLEIRGAILDGFRADVGELPKTLADLFVQPEGMHAFDPLTKTGWRGPYLLSPIGVSALSPAPLDPWRNPIVLQRPEGGVARLVSAGPDGEIQTDPTNPNPDPQNELDVGDDHVVLIGQYPPP